MLSKYTNSNSEPAHPERIHKHVFFLSLGLLCLLKMEAVEQITNVQTPREKQKNRKQMREKFEMCKRVHSEPLQMVVCVCLWGYVRYGVGGRGGGHDGRRHKIGGH